MSEDVNADPALGRCPGGWCVGARHGALDTRMTNVETTVAAIHEQVQADAQARKEQADAMKELKGLLEWHRDVQGVSHILSGTSRLILKVAAVAAAIGAFVAVAKGWVRELVL